MSYRGFDTDQFPGLETMAALKGQFDFCGFYLVAPSHKDSGWAGQRQALLVQGWSLVPIYVGQELIGPGSHLVTAEQGTIDGEDAAAQLVAEGFPLGTTVYLDLENGPPYGKAEAGYVEAVAAAIRAAGFRPGVYCSHAMAADVAAIDAELSIWAFKVPSVQRSTCRPPFPAPEVSGCGYAKAAMWQFRQNVELTGPFSGVVVDLDCAVSPDPGAP